MSVSRYFHTLRYLRPAQIVGRVAFNLRRPAADLRPGPAPRQPTGAWSDPPRRHAARAVEPRFRFLNVERELASAADWNNPEWERLWLYNLHYFDVLRAACADSERDEALISRWIRDNPPCAGVGWEPYPTSLRIVNWIKSALDGADLGGEALHSLAIQSRHLSRRLERHLRGNHLLANAKALVFSGAFFAGPEAETWLRTGLSILEREVPEQVLADGGHFERSPMYHSIVLEDLLDLINVAGRYPGAIPCAGDWRWVVPKMLRWLDAMCHPDGQISFFNDAAFDIAPEPRELREYATRLEIAPCETGGEVQRLAQSGYVSVRRGAFSMIFDAAPVGPDYLPAHAHADTLSFELSWRGRRVICNSGSSCYGSGPQREWERSTAAHNTVVVDGVNSSEVWHGFRVARRAKPYAMSVRETEGSILMSCAHDGYGRLQGQPAHSREITVARETVSWTDEITGRGAHTARGYVPLHPLFTVSERGSNACELRGPEGMVLMLEAAGGIDLHVTQGTFAPEFGKVMARPVVTWTVQGPLPLKASLRLRAVSSAHEATEARLKARQATN